MIIFAIIILGIFLRLLFLQEIPAEMWGDVIEHYKMTQDVLQGRFFFDYRFGGDGPFFSYFSALVVKFLHLSFYSLKLSTSIGGILIIFLTYFFCLELCKNKKVAYISSFLSSISFWSLSFSRQAKPYIFVVVFTLATLYFLLKKRNILAGAIAGIGMYVQAGFFGMPLYLIFRKKFRSLIVVFLLASPLMYEFFLNKNILTSQSFFAEKLSFRSGSMALVRIAENCLKNFTSFFWAGDTTFRYNVGGYPHIDYLSALFFLVGFLFIIREIVLRKKYSYFSYFVLPFLVLQIPSVLDIANPQSSPNMGRMISVMPLAYIATAFGFYRVWNYFSNYVIAKFFLIIVMISIVFLNLYHFFDLYPKQLPNENIPFGKIIADKIDTISKDRVTIVNGCCWGDWGQPEPNGIRFRLKTRRFIHFFAADTKVEEISCNIFQSQFPHKEVVLFIDPKKQKLSYEVKKCLRVESIYTLENMGYKIVRVIEGKVISSSAP